MPNVEQLSANGVLRREWRQLGRLALESLATGVFVSLVLALAVFIVSFDAKAAGNGGDVRQETLLLRFANPTPQWREGVYALPRPEMAMAVSRHRRGFGET